MLQVGETNEAIRECNKALDVDPNDVDALCDRAEAHLQNEMYDEGKLYMYIVFCALICNIQ